MNKILFLLSSFILVSCLKNDPDKLEFPYNRTLILDSISRVNVDIHNYDMRCKKLLDSLEFKIKNENLTKVAYNINMHQELYSDRIENTRKIVVQSVENIPFYVCDTLKMADADSLLNSEQTSSIFWNGMYYSLRQLESSSKKDACLSISAKSIMTPARTNTSPLAAMG